MCCTSNLFDEGNGSIFHEKWALSAEIGYQNRLTLILELCKSSHDADTFVQMRLHVTFGHLLIVLKCIVLVIYKHTCGSVTTS